MSGFAYDPDPLAIGHVTLGWLKVRVRQRVPQECAIETDVAFWRDELLDHFVYELRAKVLAESLPPEVVSERRTFRFNVPASGWQQWKASHGAKLPAWFLRRWPVRFVEHVHTGEVTVNLHRFWTFPKARAERFSSMLGEPVRLAYIEPRNVDWRPDAV